MFSRILVAVDSSEPSQRAVEVGGQLARAAGARVKLLHVIHPLPAFVGASQPDEPHPARGARELLGRLMKRLPQDVAAERDVLDGIPSQRIVEAAREWVADLVIVGDHNRHILSRFVLGSVSDAVVRHAPCSVLVVREEDQPPSSSASES
jgi:nucleotide-binding universal stress UspA family protein